MTTLLTIAEVQALGIGLDLSDAELQLVIDREEAELIRRFGPHYTGAPITETWPTNGASVYLLRAIASVTSVTEYVLFGNVSRALVANQDYYVWPNIGRIQRLFGGNWYGDRVDVVYIPQDDSNLRKSVLIDLVRLTLDMASGMGGKVSGLSFSIDSTKTSEASARTDRDAAYDRLILVPQV